MDDLLRVLQRNLRRALSDSCLDDAAALLAQIRDAAPATLETRVLGLEYLVRADRLEESAALAEQVERLHPGSPRGLYWCGRAAYLRRDYRAAERLLREADRLEARGPIARWLGKTLTQLGQLDGAEAMLTPLAEAQPACRLDLAWLHERRGELDRALHWVERYLAHDPASKAALAQRVRLRAKRLEPDELVVELSGLEDLGEEVEPNLLPGYADALLRTGRMREARELFRARLATLEPRVATSMAWAAYKLSAFDLACDAFAAALPARLRDAKLLSAFERAARMCGRPEAFAELCERHAADAPHLYGWAKRVRNRLAAEEGEGGRP